MTQRRIALAAGIGVLMVVTLGILARERLWEAYLAYRFRRIGVVAVEPGYPASSLHAISPDGTVLWRHEGGEVGFGHRAFRLGCALDTRRSRIYVQDGNRARVVALDPDGKVLFSLAHAFACGIAVAPRSGEIWCLGFEDSGKTSVFDATGKRVADHPWTGYDIAHNAFDDSFWIAGGEIRKVDGAGREVARAPVESGAYFDVDANPGDGSVWVTQYGSSDLLHLDSRAQLLQEVMLPPEGQGLQVAYDSVARTVWVSCWDWDGKGMRLLSYSTAGEPQGEWPYPGGMLAYSARDGKLWLGLEDRILALDRQGGVILEVRSPYRLAWLFAP